MTTGRHTKEMIALGQLQRPVLGNAIYIGWSNSFTSTDVPYSSTLD